VTNYKTLKHGKIHAIGKAIYLVVNLIRKDELFALTSQTKRAAVSVPCNIAEGNRANYKKDTIQFLHIAEALCMNWRLY